MSKRALFVVSDQGNGHRVRSGALRSEFESRGWECFGHLDNFPADYDVEVMDDPKESVITARTRMLTVLIVDEPRPELETHGIDLLVCGGAWATPEAFGECGAKRVLAGPSFALLRSEFAKEPEETGVAFNYAHTEIFDARAIDGMPAWAVADSMRHAKVVITYAGMRSIEAACVGAPMVLVSRNEGEDLNAIGLILAGAGIHCGDDTAVAMVAANLLLQGETRAEMSSAGRALVDGLGCKRVADEIERL